MPITPQKRHVPTALAALAAACCIAGQAAPVADALARPSLASAQAARSVVLGAAQAGTRLVAVGERGIVLLSDDGGQHWRQVQAPVSVTLTAVRFADAQHGYAVGHGGVVLATADGGDHWTPRLDGRRAAQLVADAAKTSNDDKALKDAERLVADGPDKPFLDLLVQDAQHVVAVGAYGLAVASDDGGATWTAWTARLPNPRGLHLNALRARGDTVLIAGEQGLVLRSDDRGQSFRKIDTPYKGSYFTAELPPVPAGSDDMVVAGLRGNVWRSRDGGSTWSQWPVPMPVSITGSALAPQGALLFVNQAGRVLRGATDGDGALLPLPGAPLPPLAGVLPLAGGKLLALSLAGPIAIEATQP